MEAALVGTYREHASEQMKKKSRSRAEETVLYLHHGLGDEGREGVTYLVVVILSP